MKYITILCDFNFLNYALALLFSIDKFNKNDLFIHFLCLDDDTYNIVSKLNMYKNIICYKEEILLVDENIYNLKISNKQYYFWALASLFTNYIIQNNNCESVMYIDSDIFFHLDIHILYDTFGNKDVGIFRHRFRDHIHLHNSGEFNVGVVYFKNSNKGREVLNWWADAVLFKKYPELATCGDQKYLNHFPKMCNNDEIYIDSNIGHGAPWNWSMYNNDNIHNYEIVFNSQKQPLVFTHFSKFNFSIEKNEYYHSTNYYLCFTNDNHIYNHEGLKKIHDDYFVEIKKADELIKSINKQIHYNIKIAVGIIVFESDFVLKQCIEQIYPFVDQILISEGPVKFWQDKGKITSEDNTNYILDNFPDPEKKIKIVHGKFNEKLEESNAYMANINDDIDYVWQIDADELYTNDDILKIKKMLIDEKPTSVGVRSCSFYGGFDNYLTGFELNKDNFLRIFKFVKGTTWLSHRPPTMNYPYEIQKKHIDSDELWNKYGVQMYHYSYVFPLQVKTKISYYGSLSQDGIIEDYFINIYLKWVNSDDKYKKIVEEQYNGVHEWKPHRRGDCYTTKFNLKHPETIQRDLNILKQRFNDELSIVMSCYEKEWENIQVSKNQLELNKMELNNNYPPHWINLLNILKTIPNINDIIFHDIPCGVGTTYKLLKNNGFNFLYKGYDMSKYMIETAKNEWNYPDFNICNINEFKITGDNNLIYVDGLLDILHNSPDIFNKILSIKCKYVIINRIHFCDKKEISMYKAYNINIIDYKYHYDEFTDIINNNNYHIKHKIDNLFLLELNDNCIMIHNGPTVI